MPYSLANLTLLFPIACALAIAVALTGNMIVRPKPDLIRTALRLGIWQLLLFSVVGLLLRASYLHMIWVVLLVVFGVFTIFWKRSLARNIVALSYLATDGDPKRLQMLGHYMKAETNGYWYRLGSKVFAAWSASGDWLLAARRAGIIRGVRPLSAIGILGVTGRPQYLREEMRGSAQQRELHSRWLGRIVAASLSLIPMAAIGSSFSNALGGPIARLMREFNGPDGETWQLSLASSLADSGVHLLCAAGVWLAIVALYLLHSFPRLTRYNPLEWFCRPYYRGVSLRSLAETLRAEPRLPAACRVAARALPIPTWSSRLTGAAISVENGLEAAVALRKAGLINRRQVDVVALCRDDQALARTLDQAGTETIQRNNERLSLLVQMTVVLLVLLSATFTLIFSSAVFSSLADWIMSLER